MNRIYSVVLTALVLSAVSFPVAPLTAGEHSCDKLAEAMCNMCGEGSTACTEAREVATECKAQSQYCPATACAPSLGALERIPESQRKLACQKK